VLADFRSWLTALVSTSDDPAPDEDAGPDLFTLLEQMTALRHEVNLQTRSSRSLQEQNAATLTELSRALNSLEQATSAQEPDADERLRPLLKCLVDVYDALSIASREAQRVHDTVAPLLSESAGDALPDLPEPPKWKPSVLVRWLSPGASDAAAFCNGVASLQTRNEGIAVQRGQAFQRVRQLLASLTAGYAMSLQRVERALKQHGLEPVSAAGQPFDPERMEAVEAVSDSQHPAGRVIDEVQRGYLWNGRVFRYAKVRVAKSSG
jgi:molecular chaperone GrpE